ncbi:transferrin-binding protein-like solute binding protein [Neisseria montereyensis]|uniref:Transferrin-binding protein B n=1 Tax=Neisseria montereyensis TaxID=2973938 RepID=A0ABT2FEI1_9NEIS|nr:transferrin-binding protein-like solute binding protein [Neisseria montereyensis]MCS4534619.1 transferrin-binding protein-like solute binding protein [Neisseria montereyensis]
MIKPIKNISSSVAALFLLSACAGGSFDTLNVNPEPTPLPEPPSVEKVPEPRQNPEEQEALKRPAMGFVMGGVRRNTAKYDKEGEPVVDENGQDTDAETYVALDPNTIEAVDDLDSITPKQDEMRLDPDVRRVRTYVNGYVGDKKDYKYIRVGHVYDNFPRAVENSVYLDDIGERRYYEIRDGWKVFTFYHGTSAASALPVGKQVNYEGEWYFHSDAKLDKAPRGSFQSNNGFESYANGDVASAAGITNSGVRSAKYTSQFTVNFDDKSLTGSLRDQSEIRVGENRDTELYTIEAQLNGNRFTGKAKSAVNENSSDIEKAFFYADSDFVEGGFYGPKGEELAGKFLTNDNSLFGVFGAKRDDKTPVDTRTLFDAYYIPRPRVTEIDYDQAEEFNEEGEELLSYDRLTEAESKPLGNFGFAMRLRFGGKVFDLDRNELSEAFLKDNPDAEISVDENGKTRLITFDKNSEGRARQSIQACCTNLSYLTFGQWNLAEKEGRSPTSALFIQGERTAINDIPQTGKARYIGTWSGFINTLNPRGTDALSNPNFAHNADLSNFGKGGAGSLSEFDVDFGNKSLTGSLYANDSRKVFGINATINGNGFSGTGSTDGAFPFDAGNQTNGYRVNIQNAQVNGGFYGPGAQELGGTLIYNSRADGTRGEAIRAGAVFGAQKQ